MVHYHAGHNVSGYLPMDDECPSYATFGEAQSALSSDPEYALECEADYRADPDEDYLSELEQADAALGVSSGPEFLIYTSTNPGSDHDIPTAWWVRECGESDCEPVDGS